MAHLLIMLALSQAAELHSYHYGKFTIQATSLRQAAKICFMSLQNKPFSYERGLDNIDYCVNPRKISPSTEKDKK